MRDTRRARLVLGLLLAAALVLITVDHRGGQESPLEPLRAAGAAVFGRAEQAGAALLRPVGDVVEMLITAPAARRRIEELRRENARLRSELIAAGLDRRRADRLDRMLGLAGLGGYTVVPAQVIARRGVPGFEDTVEIDVGTADGVRPNMTVLSGEGLIGRVVRAGRHTAGVVLLTDPASSVGARLAGGEELGVVSGLGAAGGAARLMRFRLLDQTAALTPGHPVVSFGSQGGAPYVPGVPIGVIHRVEVTPGELTRTAYVRPYADFTALDVVGVVVRAPARDPRDAVLPAAASPAAAAGR